MKRRKDNIGPAFDPEYIKRHPYRLIVADEYDMDSGYRIVRPKGLADHLLILTLSGCGQACGEKLEPGSLYHFKPQEPHDYGTEDKRWHFLWAHVHAPSNWNWLLSWRLANLAALPDCERRRIVALFREVVRLHSSASRYDEALAVNLMENLLLRLMRYFPEITGMKFRDSVDDFIRKHLTEALDVPRLARMAKLSESRFAHLFREIFGSSPQAYVENCRIDMAKRIMLATNLSIKEIAYRCGFANPLYFSKRFAKASGVSPSKWLATRLNEK